MLSELRPTLLFPVKKDSIGKGTLASVLLSYSCCCVLEKEKKKGEETTQSMQATQIILGSDASNIRSEPAGNLDYALSIALALTPNQGT